jgi:hypothetical protein
VAPVSLYRFHHDFQRWVDDVAGLLGVEILDQLHRTLNVCKQRRNRFALGIEACGGCGLSHSKRRVARLLCCRPRRRSERCAALAAEAFAWRIFHAAFRTTIPQRRAAIAAEFLVAWVLCAALRAKHR